MNTTWIQYIPPTHIIVWMFAGIIILWKLSPFLRAMREACSEPDKDDKRGKVSRKRIIPLLFTGTVVYMIIASMHGGKIFNEPAFWGLLGYIALDTSVITVTQADGFLDRISALKGSAIKREQQKTISEKTTEVTTDERSVATVA